MNREQRIEFIQAIEDTKALERAILDIIDELKSEGSKEIADGLEQLIPISNNRFSVIGQKELLQESKRRAKNSADLGVRVQTSNTILQQRWLLRG